MDSPYRVKVCGFDDRLKYVCRFELPPVKRSTFLILKLVNANNTSFVEWSMYIMLATPNLLLVKKKLLGIEFTLTSVCSELWIFKTEDSKNAKLLGLFLSTCCDSWGTLCCYLFELI
jgi:hypothetical protein